MSYCGLSIGNVYIYEYLLIPLAIISLGVAFYGQRQFLRRGKTTINLLYAIVFIIFGARIVIAMIPYFIASQRYYNYNTLFAFETLSYWLGDVMSLILGFVTLLELNFIHGINLKTLSLLVVPCVFLGVLWIILNSVFSTSVYYFLVSIPLIFCSLYGFMQYDYLKKNQIPFSHLTWLIPGLVLGIYNIITTATYYTCFLFFSTITIQWFLLMVAMYCLIKYIHIRDSCNSNGHSAYQPIEQETTRGDTV
ncbi:hypothetical protein CYY_007457 [Polysphondylium violaceum]|uniref:Uncharacterized protein n=1 Tax=Polysphondylium violaceum TaxID=133409 RepID=A0A8J4PP83_9MYCE|nr:hypothetical protein CYY_007457 [Polysphondylium violaceum]